MFVFPRVRNLFLTINKKKLIKSDFFFDFQKKQKTKPKKHNAG